MSEYPMLWVAVFAAMLLMLFGCTAPPRCTVVDEAVQQIGADSAGNILQVRQFLERCPV